jgi:Zn-dependent protease
MTFHEAMHGFVVGLAGPLTNLLFAVVAGVAVRMVGNSLGSTPLIALEAFAQVNIAFFLFNMIPYPPLDGSRLLYAIAPDKLREIMTAIENFGIFGLLIFMLIFYQLISPIFLQVYQAFYAFIVGSVGI